MDKKECDLKDKSVVAVTFSKVKFFDYVKSSKIEYVELEKEAIIEIAAVKVEGRKIKGHFHSFVALDGYDAHYVEFHNLSFETYGVAEDMLIGAPSLKEVIRQFKEYVGDSILMPYCNGIDNPIEILKAKAQEYGYKWDYQIIYPSDMGTALKLKNAMADRGAITEDTSLLQIADMIHEKPRTWEDTFLNHGVFFTPGEGEEWSKTRNDPLGWAIAFAKYYIAVIEEEEDIDENFTPIDDDDLPF